ncbi:unnamed protein product [Trichobilharzia szidati]|nr:unnamed protein product [Trichobilharzia szidati]
MLERTELLKLFIFSVDDIQILSHAIIFIPQKLIRNKRSYEQQMQKVGKLFQSDVNNLKKLINELCIQLEIQSLNLNQLGKWLKATQGWILIRKYIYQQKYISWKVKLMQTYHHIQTVDSCKEFVRVIFGNEAANYPTWKKSQHQSMEQTRFVLWKTERSWLQYRREIMEAQLSIQSKDEINRIENELRSREGIKRNSSHHSYKIKDKKDRFLDETISRIVQKSELLKYPYSINHPLHIHEQQLIKTQNHLKVERLSTQNKIRLKQGELNSILNYVKAVKCQIASHYIICTKVNLNELEKRRHMLTKLLKVLDELRENEAAEMDNLAKERTNSFAMRSKLEKELKHLQVCQSINAENRFSYFCYRYNLPLCKL